MLVNVVQSAFGRLGGSFSKAFLGQPCRKESGDNAVLLSSSGNIYRLETVLGVGGLSVVYRAYRYSDGKEVAVKVANTNKAPEAKALLAREAELMAHLQHESIVELYESGTTVDGDPFIAMEILEGQTLEQLLVTQNALDLHRVARICLQVADAVQHAHENGILHRDIKPGNIMIVNRDGVEKAIIYDFGISLCVGADGSSYDDTSSGSLLYASPEQLDEQICSYNTDVYQLALVMFEALTGRLPFEISVKGALDYRRGRGPVLLSDEELGEQKLCEGIRRVLEKALDRNPKKRTVNMMSFINELKQALMEPGTWGFKSNTARMA